MGKKVNDKVVLKKKTPVPVILKKKMKKKKTNIKKAEANPVDPPISLPTSPIILKKKMKKKKKHFEQVDPVDLDLPLPSPTSPPVILKKKLNKKKKIIEAADPVDLPISSPASSINLKRKMKKKKKIIEEVDPVDPVDLPISSPTSSPILKRKMKKKKKMTVEEEDEDANQPLPTPTSSVITNSSSVIVGVPKAFCLFCYKRVNIKSDQVQLEKFNYCKQFYNQLTLQETIKDLNCSEIDKENLDASLNSTLNSSSFFWMDDDDPEPVPPTPPPPPPASPPKKRRKMDDANLDASIGEEDNLPTKYDACNDCFFVIKMYVDMYQEIEELQISLKGHLKSIYQVMKFAGKVGSRVKVFKESLLYPMAPPPPPPPPKKRKGRGRLPKKVKEAVENLEENHILEVREKIFRTCKTRLHSNSKKTTTASVGTYTTNSNDKCSSTGNPTEQENEEKEQDPDEIEVVGVVKKEVEQVTLNLNPSEYHDATENNTEDGSEDATGSSDNESSDDPDFRKVKVRIPRQKPEEKEEDPKDVEPAKIFPFGSASWISGMDNAQPNISGIVTSDPGEEGGASTYRCIKCTFTFTTEQDLIDHCTSNGHYFSTDEDAQQQDACEVQIKCKFCKVRFGKLDILIDHELKKKCQSTKSFSNIKIKMKCSRCSKILGKSLYDKRRHYLKFHIKLKKDFQTECKDCEIIFKGRSQWLANNGLKRHLNSKKHQIKVNGSNDHEDKDKVKVLKKKKKDKKMKYNCSICGKGFQFMKQLNGHVQRGHNSTKKFNEDQEQKKFKCYFCNKEYKSGNSLFGHLKKYHRQYE